MTSSQIMRTVSDTKNQKSGHRLMHRMVHIMDQSEIIFHKEDDTSNGKHCEERYWVVDPFWRDKLEKFFSEHSRGVA